MDDLIARMRALEVDHLPNGWPPVQMRDISALCTEIERLAKSKAAHDEVVKNSKRYLWLRDVSVPVEFHDVLYTPAEVDSAIDAAIDAAGNEPSFR